MTNLTTRLIVCMSCCLFILLGALVIPYAGVQNDEALFTNPLYILNSKDFSMTVFHRQVVLMVMSYIGTLKTMLYLPIFAAFGVSVWSLRLPMVLAGTLTIWIFFHLTFRAAGRPAALVAATLLATDPVFLLANTFDWGPVALQHLLLVTGCFFLVRFGQASSRRDLAFGFFFLGLAMWNKAVFVWALAGLAGGGLAVFWPEVRKALNPANLAVAAVAFLCGASPLVIYNIRHPNSTAKSNARFETENFGHKFESLRYTINGSGLLGFISAEDDNPKAPSSRAGRVAAWIHTRLGDHRTGGQGYAFALALLAVPVWWRSRAARFALVFIAVAWAAMALTRDAGGAVHHTVLLWPFPHLFIAAVLGSLGWRAVTVVAGVVLVVMNLLVMNQHFFQFERNGAAGNWTDAMYGLSEALHDPADRTTEQPIYIMDWGMANTLSLFHQGRLLLRIGNDPFATDTPNAAEQKTAGIMLSDPNALFVGHVPSREVISGVSERLNRASLTAGRQKELLRTIPDSNGHPVFEIFRFR